MLSLLASTLTSKVFGVVAVYASTVFAILQHANASCVETAFFSFFFFCQASFFLFFLFFFFFSFFFLSQAFFLAFFSQDFFFFFFLVRLFFFSFFFSLLQCFRVLVTDLWDQNDSPAFAFRFVFFYKIKSGFRSSYLPAKEINFERV